MKRCEENEINCLINELKGLFLVLYSEGATPNKNHLGSNVLVARRDGYIAQSNHYYPFGLTMSFSSGQGVQPYKYTGKELDMEHGLMQYDPAVGRFMMLDPLAEKYYSISPYAYCANNPLRFVDPDGRDIKIKFQNEDGRTYAWTFNGSNQDRAPRNQFVSDFLTVYNYNIKNGGGDNLKAAATTTDYTLNLEQTREDSYFRTTFRGPRTEGTVFWNPTAGIETSKGTLSPATILEHEMDHGVHWQTNTEQYLKDKDINKSTDPHIGNKEEKRVITGSEYKTGVANGELKPVPKGKEHNSSSYRGHVKNSGNTRVIVESPISNKKKP